MPSETFWNGGLMPAAIEVTGELGNLCAARQAELEVARKKKNDREAEIKRLLAVNAELVEALEEGVEIFWTLNSWHDRDRFRKLFPGHWTVRSEALIEKAEGS